MNKYTDQITYIDQKLTIGESILIDYWDEKTKKFPEQIELLNPIYKNAENIFNQKYYSYPYLPIFMGKEEIDVSEINVNVLRLLISDPFKCKLGICLPQEILPFKNFIVKNVIYWKNYFNNFNPFIYLTIRTILDNKSHATSKIWHVDGFQGIRLNRYLPEQNIIWSNINPTEFLLQPFNVEKFDYSKYNIHHYFNKNANYECIYSGIENGVYLTDPYHIHRASLNKIYKKRIFARLTFSQVEIPDHTNTINPMLPTNFSIRNDIRNQLIDYNHIFENYGFIKKEQEL